jgi:predicted ArsR family transcriptional regulator
MGCNAEATQAKYERRMRELDAALLAHGELVASEVAVRLGLSRRAAQGFLARCVRNGRVVRVARVAALGFTPVYRLPMITEAS